ncbi:MAG TPA: hypothetical protein VGU61_18710 [Noviherbaspirillum sp.]|uniref:hypothetical protein n=1 Tax=Noviherbaspirillum sp. TaxID=1926288 RepID=UPI002DDCD713|nr:hypothetical protein [Noviherbaspirillum sp.]HEV2612301.1 hypothetical protein [Noviherbaspirillum sp.]
MTQQRHPPRHMKYAMRGHTLVELALAMMIAGLIGLALWQLVPRVKSLPAVARLTATPLQTAEQALQGYVLIHGRLPLPASTPGGAEDATFAGTTGWLPVQTLGITLRAPIRYGVYRAPSNLIPEDADLATAKNRYVQMLPPGAVSAGINGLDFCAALINAQRTPGASLTAGTPAAPIAYGLAVAGSDGQFAGLNTTAGRFEAGGTPKNAAYDNETVTVGAPELFGKLGCVSRIAAANSAARAAYAAYDSDRVAAMILRFRTFAISVRELNLTLAGVGVALATVDLIDAVATTATAIALAVETAGGLAGAIAGGALAIAAATASEAAAIASTVTATQALQKAREQELAAQQYKAVSSAEAAAAAARATGQDAKGLLP